MRKSQTHCKNGHELSGDNLHIDKRGFRICEKCRKAYFIEWHRKHRPTPERKRMAYEASQRWEAKNRQKRKTHLILKKAIKYGKLKREPCKVCGEERTDGHHEDYSKPLEVIWVCRQHHKDLHA